MGRDLGKTSLVVTHDIPTINSVADKIVFIHSGSVIYEGFYNDMIKSDNPYVVQFMNGRTEGPIATIGCFYEQGNKSRAFDRGKPYNVLCSVCVSGVCVSLIHDLIPQVKVQLIPGWFW